MAALYRVRTVLNFGSGSPGLSTNYFRVTGGAPGTSGDATTVAGRVRSAWDVWKAMMPATATAQVQSTVDVLSDTDAALIASWGITPPAIVVSTGASFAGPQQVMAGVRFFTNQVVGRRRLQGRTFLGPLVSTQTPFPVPQAGLVTATAAYVTALLTATPPAATAPMGVWHRPTAVGASDGLLADITGGQLDFNKWYTLNSRRD